HPRSGVRARWATHRPQPLGFLGWSRRLAQPYRQQPRRDPGRGALKVVGDITLKPGTETNDFVPWSTTRGGSMTSTPIVYGDYIYSINVSGIVGCYDARTGARQYLKRLEHCSRQTRW